MLAILFRDVRAEEDLGCMDVLNQLLSRDSGVAGEYGALVENRTSDFSVCMQLALLGGDRQKPMSSSTVRTGDTG